ncbi:hypothetical protein D3X12_28915 [Pseudomonas protegens]|uniref:Uncharacterized protein n=1 Tax=Pseudomonas protegens TaxID=380021 RepID=A0ABY2VF43_9PSED|nr:hypothetical protein [Pseudomonas protegens]ASE21913.1 hypothetical protein CEP86_16050 [Pseudomonas protegens]OBZ20240.1 hypothetical protein BBH58_28740 [Pseudomonas protegens]OBZ21343.1 hypothetical protein BBH57_28775 [Pseudomonas protegens]OKK40616.1 hypothetical protein BS643_23040 [Pseudomonas protegens]OKK52790.1 hypothetical protein BS644_02825 [Pseudomonas protegens]
MPQASQIFAGQVFVTNPFVTNSLLRLDILEQRFSQQIEESIDEATQACGLHFKIYEAHLLNALLKRAASYQFPHNELFKRVAEQQGFKLDYQHYLLAKKTASALMDNIING